MLTTIHSDGTLVKIEIQHLVNIIKKIVISFQKIGQCPVNETRLGFRPGHFTIKINIKAATKHSHIIPQCLFGIFQIGNQHIGNDQRAGIYERVPGNAFFVFKLD